MRISVTRLGDTDELLTIDVAPDLTVKDLKAVIASESNFGIKVEEMLLYFDGKLLSNENQTLKALNMRDYDMVTCDRRIPRESSNPGAAQGMRLALDPRNPQRVLDAIRSDPSALERFRQRDPYFARIIERNDLNGFMQYLTNQVSQQHRRPLNEVDLLDPRIQQRIEETINMENVIDNMEHAYEHAPEFFGNVIMLYIDCKINGHPLKAFVDSGAQMTIMSKACAERCGMMRLIDRRFAGIAKGVGTQKILGRIHLAQLEIEKQFFATSLAVLEEQSIDILLGLDMLRRHRCVIDLNKNILRLENTVETSFLPESELPAFARLSVSSPGDETPNLSESFVRSTAASADNRNQQSTASATTGASSPFPEKDINEIVKKGLTREQAIEELRAANGNVTTAIVTVMAKMLGQPKRKS